MSSICPGCSPDGKCSIECPGGRCCYCEVPFPQSERSDIDNEGTGHTITINGEPFYNLRKGSVLLHGDYFQQNGAVYPIGRTMAGTCVTSAYFFRRVGAVHRCSIIVASDESRCECGLQRETLDPRTAIGEDLDRIAESLGALWIKRCDGEPDADVRERVLSELEDNEMNRLFTAGLAQANDTYAMLTAGGHLSATGPVTCAIFCGVAKMILEGRKR